MGAFLAFTLSQSGMVVHWWKVRNTPAESHRSKLLINAIGAAATGLALIVILMAKFWEGAWITLIAIPVLITLFKSIHRYYRHVESDILSLRPLDLSSNKPPVVIIPTEGWNLLTQKALRFGMRLSPDVIAIHLSAIADSDESQQEKEFRSTGSGMWASRPLIMNCRRRNSKQFIQPTELLPSPCWNTYPKFWRVFPSGKFRSSYPN